MARTFNKLALLRAAQVGMTALAVSAMAIVLHPDLRTYARSVVRQDFRTVVSTARGDLTGTGSLYTVAKVKTRDNMYLEIFQTIADGAPQLVERIELADSRDAFFNFNAGEGATNDKTITSNLAIADIDGDGRPEILAPTFDRNLVGRLNVVRYNDSTNGFSQIVR